MLTMIAGALQISIHVGCQSGILLAMRFTHCAKASAVIVFFEMLQLRQQVTRLPAA